MSIVCLIWIRQRSTCLEARMCSACWQRGKGGGRAFKERDGDGEAERGGERAEEGAGQIKESEWVGGFDSVGTEPLPLKTDPRRMNKPFESAADTHLPNSACGERSAQLGGTAWSSWREPGRGSRSCASPGAQIMKAPGRLKPDVILWPPQCLFMVQVLISSSRSLWLFQAS